MEKESLKTEKLNIYTSLPVATKNIWANYDESFQFLQQRKTRQVQQLVLLNNLQRGDMNIASTLLITLFNRILSNLYDDKPQVKFIPGEELEQEKVNKINILFQNDYREMDMDKIEYDWIWDTLFFGRGYLETYQFDKKRKLLKPCVINPLSFGYDPFFDLPQQWRYYWKWKTISKWELEALIKNGTIKGITSSSEIPSGIDAFLWDYKVKREQAKQATPQANDTYQGDVFQILEYFGYDDNGDKSCFWLDRDFSKILYYEKLDLRDADDGKASKWPIVVKEAFREPHSTVNFSVADLLEDKHRAESVLLNLAFIASKDKANPIYKYVPDNIVDQTQLFNRQINQHIPVKDLANSVDVLNTTNPMDPGLAAFMQILSQKANDPIGTGMALNPIKKGKQTATEQAIQQQLNDLAQSLQSKVLKFGEEEFCSAWYQRYKRYTKAGDEKIAAIVGVKGMTFENIDLEAIHTKYPPGVLIYSSKEAEYKQLVKRRDYMQMYPQFQQTFDPDGMRAFNRYVFLPMMFDDPTMIDVVIPKTLDEIKAEDENEVMNQNKQMPQVSDTDNHQQHIMVHRMAKNTHAKWIHIMWHEELLAMQKKAQMMQQQMQPQPQQGQEPQPGQDQKNPVQDNEAATPLKAETQTSIKQGKK